MTASGHSDFGNFEFPLVRPVPTGLPRPVFFVTANRAHDLQVPSILIPLNFADAPPFTSSFPVPSLPRSTSPPHPGPDEKTEKNLDKGTEARRAARIPASPGGYSRHPDKRKRPCKKQKADRSRGGIGIVEIWPALTAFGKFLGRKKNKNFGSSLHTPNRPGRDNSSSLTRFYWAVSLSRKEQRREGNLWRSDCPQFRAIFSSPYCQNPMELTSRPSVSIRKCGPRWSTHTHSKPRSVCRAIRIGKGVAHTPSRSSSWRASSAWEIPRNVTPSAPSRLESRSRNGKRELADGHAILKNAATTGPSSLGS